MPDTTNKLRVLDTAGVRRVFVLGDIHGDLGALTRAVAQLSPRDAAVLLGDYADRGPDGVEVLEALMTLTERDPDRFIALKGNHEDFSDDGTPIFYPCTLVDEVARKGRSWREFFPIYKAFVDQLPIAAIIPEYALLVHGGISSAIGSITDLEAPSSSVENDILWSDPGSESGEHRSPRGAGILFGPDISHTVLGRLGLRHVYRSHQPRRASSGPVVEHGARVVTTSCTSVYGGRAFAMILPVNELPESPEEIAASAEFL